jgi:hypothetical protein
MPEPGDARGPDWKTWLAFAIIYLVWGTTFLAIRVGVREVPPFLLAVNQQSSLAGLSDDHEAFFSSGVVRV